VSLLHSAEAACGRQRVGDSQAPESFSLWDPEATGAAILKVVDATDPPLRIFFGSVGLPMMRAEYAKRIEGWEKWNPVSIEAQGNPPGKSSRWSEGPCYFGAGG
jgi:hypothetical protein